jgi:regulator of replication initiation timing
MEIRIPSGQNLEAYLEDATETGSIWEKIADLITDIIGLSDENKELKERIEELERIAQDHEERISALEDK